MGKLSLIVLLIIGWFSLATYWYVCEIGDFCGEESPQQVEKLSESVKELEEGTPTETDDQADEQPAELVDTDGDGLLDTQEDANRNGEVDEDETDPNKADTDGDGADDKEEIDAGTDPLDSTSSPEQQEDPEQPEDPETPAETSFTDNVFFGPDSDQLTSASSNQTIIEDAIAFAEENSSTTITLTGFTASLSSEVVDDDKALAQSRAETVQAIMVAGGIAESRITIDAQGDTSSGSPEESRRVTIEVE